MKSKLLLSLLFLLCLFFTPALVAQTVPTASFAMSSATICAEGSVQLTDQSLATPTAWSYSVNGVMTSVLQNPEITFSTSGTYSIDLEATNNTGTSPVYSQTLFVQVLPTITVSGSTLVCTAAASTLSATGADTYTWDSGSNMNMVTINPLSNSVYTLVGTSTLTGCSDSNFVSVFTVPLPTISVSGATVCSGTAYTLNPSGASTYSYSGGSGIVTPTSNTSYTVSGTDALTGCSDSVVVALTVNSVSITAGNGTICAGQSFTISASGASTYTYSGGSNIVSPTVNTTYTVSGSDATTGCSDSIAVVVAVAASPTISVNTGSLCAGSIFTIVPSGASNYTFSSGSNTVAPLTNTTYIISGIDPISGCVGYKTFSLSVNPTPTVTVNSGTICSGDVFTMVPSGASTYTFSSGTNTVSPLTTTQYSVTGIDAGGCASHAAGVSTVIVSGSKPIVSITANSSSVICAGQSVILTAIGATNYTWSTGATTPTVLVTPGVTTLFSVTGLDLLSGCAGPSSILQYVNDCTGIEANALAVQFNLYPNPTSGNLSIETISNSSLSILNNLGELVLNQELHSGTTTLDLNALPNGIYFVTLKQDNATKTVRVIKH